MHKESTESRQSLQEGRTITFFIPGRPATKKTGQRIVRCGTYHKILPSRQYCEYEEYCIVWLGRIKERFTGKVAISAVYTMPNRKSWPDLVGLMQATGDILEKAKIIANDRDIVSWDGSRIAKIDMQKTGVQITITEITPF